MARLEVQDLSHVYLPGTPLARAALSGVSFEIGSGEGVGIVGSTGSGKTTLLSHLNGLLRPTSGEVRLDGVPLFSRDLPMHDVRRRVGLLFQFPEWQLFAHTVAEDVGFGLAQKGISEEELGERIGNALALVDLAPKDFALRDPLELSGGEKRRVALAGVLVMEPEVLVLDEPTIGLDPLTRAHLLDLLADLRRTRRISLVVASHDLEELTVLVDRVLLLEQGRVMFRGGISDLLEREERDLAAAGLVLPELVRVARALKPRFPGIRTNTLLMEEVRDDILREWRGGNV